MIRHSKQEIIASNDPQFLFTQYEQLSELLGPSELSEKIHYIENLSITIIKLNKLGEKVDIKEDIISVVISNLNISQNLNLKISDLFKCLLRQVSSAVKVKWLHTLDQHYQNIKDFIQLVEITIKSIDDNLLEFYHTSSMINKLFQNFTNDALSNCSSKVLIQIYTNLHYHMTPQTWFDTWNNQVVEQLYTKAKEKNMIIYFIPKLFNVEPTIFPQFISMIRSEELVLKLGKISKDLKIPFNPPVEFLHHINEEIRVNCLSLLLYSNKSSEIIETEIFTVLTNYLPKIFKDGIESITIINQFLIRIRDSNYKAKDLKYIEQSQTFIEWLVELIHENLTPVSNYSQVFVSLNLLIKLIDLNIDGLHTKVNSDNKSKFLYSVPIFTPRLTKSLFWIINSNYDDLRQLSTEILYKTPYALEIYEKDLDNAIWLCQELKSRKSDGGSRFLTVIVYNYLHHNIKTDILIDIILKNIVDAKNFRLSLERQFRIHGLLTALTMILPILPSATFRNTKWKNYFDEILNTNYIIWNKIKFILTEVESEEDVDESKLRSFSWKYMKSATNLIVTVFKHCPVTELQYQNYIKLLIEQISTINHRGTILSIDPLFSGILSLAKKFNSVEFVESLLYQNLINISTMSQIITRRSGGLPFLTTGMLTGVISLSPEKDHISRTLNALFEIVNSPVVENTRYDLPQVNALNCIRAIFNDTNLVTSSFTKQALMLSIKHFSSQWSIKNCALMLFNAIQHKVFNGKKIPVGEFEFGMTTLFEWLDADDLGILIPVLLLISNLRFDDDSMEKKLISLFNNRNWKIREMVSRTLCNMLPHNNTTILNLMSLIQEDINFNHGIYLTILEILKSSSLDVVELLRLIKHRNWALVKVYVKFLAYTAVSKEVIDEMNELFVNNYANCEYDGLKKLALGEIFEFLLNSGKIDYWLLSNLNYDFTNILIDYLVKHPDAIVPQLNILDNYTNSKYLDLLIKSHTIRDIPLGSDEELNAKIIQINPAVADLELLNHYSNDEKSVSIRLGGLMAISKLFKTDLPDSIKVILLRYLSDDDKLIRNETAKYLTGLNLNESSIIKSLEYSNGEALINEIIHWKYSLPAFIDNFNDDSARFELDIVNEYRSNHIELLISILAKTGADLQPLLQHVRERSIDIFQYINNMQYDGVIGYTYNFHVYESIKDFQVLLTFTKQFDDDLNTRYIEFQTLCTKFCIIL